MARVRFYVATSLDGFIAGVDGSADWMAPYDGRLYGYDRFLSEVGAVIIFSHCGAKQAQGTHQQDRQSLAPIKASQCSR